ncbi:hypothetical protein I7G59_06520 [Sinorhizobium meliloti]|uniref:hypothetical protein n=1 Tax=Rhizobium meliloti TaxID=382 RepID=UPI00237FFE48|nr:hypothetical protein [Sinorhizobium meliloti]MDE3796988.1 hypothetical protein [Sinorhizobium meliloti]
MDNWLKILSAIACTCVIAVSAHYGYEQYAEHQEAEMREAIAVRIARDKAQKAQRVAEIRRAAEESALKAACDTRVPSQSTDNLKRLYKQCLEYNRPIYVSGN